MIRRPPRSTPLYSSAASDVYKRQRQNIQLHWVRIEDAPQIWSRLEAVGLQTTEACGDCPRVVLGSPVAGISRDELIDPTWAIEEIKRLSSATPTSPTSPASSRQR